MGEQADLIGYHIDKKLVKKWDGIKDGKLVKADEDRVYIVDGREGSGKSLFAIQQGAYIDPTILTDINRITFSVDETLEAIRQTKSTKNETKAIIFDEAFRGLSSRSALSKTNKRIIQALMEMRQNNLVLFIVLPSFYMLDLYPAISRSNALFHIVKKKGSLLRSFHVYNYAKKAKLYNIGLKKGWNYNLHTKVKGRFYGAWPGGSEFKERYLKKKQQSLYSMDSDLVKDAEESRYKKKLELMIMNFYKEKDLSLRETSEQLKRIGVEVSHTEIANIRDRTLGKITDSPVNVKL